METNFDVVVVGCGPVGAVVGNFLGMYGIKTLILERELTEHGQPRAFSCDDEAMRIYQQIGLDAELKATMMECQFVDYTGARDQVFAEILFEKINFGFGSRALYFFHQPVLESILRKGVQRFKNVTLRLGHEVRTLTQTSDGVNLEVFDTTTQQTYTVTSQYVLGCDGAKSVVRKLVGIAMEGDHYEEPWLAISGIVPDEAVRLHHTRFVCNPKRTAFVGRGPFGQYRFEFKLNPGETREEMEKPEKVQALLSPYLEPDQFEMQRGAVYTFSNSVAHQWRQGRVFLLGDAAHLMPPFMGQGLVSGLRDVVNLCWKLVFTLRGANPHLLATYEQERRPHVKEMQDMSVKMGYVFMAKNTLVAHTRDLFFTLIQKIPAVRNFIQLMKFKPAPVYQAGLMLNGKRRHKNAPEGVYFPQPTLKDTSGQMCRLDEALGNGFAVVGLNVDPQTLVTDPALWEKLDTCFVKVTTTGQSDAWQDDGTLKLWFEKHEARIAIIRPDRFVFAAGQELQALETALKAAIL